MIPVRVATWLALGCLAFAASVDAGQSAHPFAFDGPSPPQPPAVIARDASGGVTVRAVRVTSPLRIDGRLDEAIYSTPSMSDFIQVEPNAGMPETQKTEVWVAFDDDNVYVTFKCWEEHLERIVARELRRDNSNIYQNEYVSWLFDTFYDRRNGANFSVNPIGGRADGQLTNERQYNGDWNPVYDFAVGRFDGGWTMESAVPFKSLRYRPGRTQIWGFNAQRNNRWKNEITFLTRVPAARGNSGIFQVSAAATLVGLEVPDGSKNLEIKPYVTSSLTTDLSARPQIANDLKGQFGGDVKYGLTPNLTADVTYNPDFAQVEADEQQINLTRFSLFFPEKREFFLENQGTFAFGGAVTSGSAAGTTDTPILFYSRKIGLNQGRIIPLDAGGRMTGRLGRFNVGVLNVQSDQERISASPATNFSVLRLKRDILRRSAIGAMYTGRTVDQDGLGRNDAYGVDGSFNFFANLAVNTFWARTHSAGRRGDDTSYRAQLDYPGDRYGVQLERLFVGELFNPGLGFVRRNDMLRHYGQFRFSPRPRNHKQVRKLVWIGSVNHVENGSGRVETRNLDGEFAIEFHNGDRFSVGAMHAYEFLPQPFRIASGVTLPIAGYDYGSVRAAFNLGLQRLVSGNLAFERGTFYDGDKTTVAFSRGRTNFTPRFSVEPTVSVNWVDLVEGSFVTRLLGSRVTYTMTTRMFVSALLQYNSGSNTMASNVRLRWEYRPGSELFVVYNDERDTLARSFPGLVNRALILKINRLFRF